MPVDQPMVVEARIPVEEIDDVTVGQSARVLFSAFNRRTTPELAGTVSEVSADRVIDTATGAAWYPVVLTIAESEMRELGDLRLVSGMPAEVFVTTESRTPLSYLLKPVTDQLRRAMKE